jgi:hypothetical protein
MGDMGDYFNDLKAALRIARETHGVDCPQCKIVRPKAHPSILLPGQKCKVDGYRDPRPRVYADDEARNLVKPSTIAAAILAMKETDQ